MADRTLATAARPVWMKQAEEAKQKSEAEKAAAAKAAFEATFKAVDKTAEKAPADDSDSDVDDESEDLKNKPVGPVDPVKCTAAGTGIAGGTACAPSSFLITTKDSDGRKITKGGAQMKVRISPGVGVGGTDQDGMVKDMGDGTYTVTYAVPKRGNYMVHVECEGRPIMGSPFPVFFSAGTPGAGLLGTPTTSPFPNLVNQTMPNMPNYAGSVSGAFPGLLGMIPGVLNGAAGGVILPGVGASLGEVCREYLNGRCSKSDCKFNHPPHNLLMTALAATTTMGTLSQVPMAPSAAAMAAAQAIVAAQALQAHAAQVQAQAHSLGDSSGSPDKAGKADALKKTLQVSNLSPLLTVEQLKQLFSYCGTVVECSITDSKHFAYIEYLKPEEATAALALNNMDVGGRPLNVEMAKSLPSKSVLGNSLHQSSLPMVMQQAVAMQQMQFQQALMMQQTIASQQAASRAATMKSATEMASARAAEISKKLKADGLLNEDKEEAQKSRSPSTSRPRSKSRSRSPIKYRRSRRSRSFSPPVRYSRDRRSRSPFRSYHHRNHVSDRRSYRGSRDSYSRGGRRNWELEREQERARDHYSSVSRRHRSKSASPRIRRSSRADSPSPKCRRESVSPRRKSSRASSKSPRHHRGSRSSPRRYHEATSHHGRRSRSNSAEDRRRSNDAKDARKSGKSKSDHVKLDISREDVEAPDLFGKDLNGSRDDRTSESPTAIHKKSSLGEDGALNVQNDVSKSAEGNDAKDVRKHGKSKLDQRKFDKSREDVEEPDLVSKYPGDFRNDRTTELPTAGHKKNSLLLEDGAFKDDTDVDKLAEFRHLSEDAKDRRKYRKSKTDGRKLEKSGDDIEVLDHVLKDPEYLREDRGSDSPKLTHKKYLLTEGRALKDEKDVIKHEMFGLDDENSDRTEAVIKNQDGVENSSVDLLVKNRAASPPLSKSQKDSSAYAGDGTTSIAVDDLPHRKVSSEYRKREKNESSRERVSLVGESKREDRRASDSLKFGSHRRSSKHLDDRSSRREDDRSRHEESKREYLKRDKTRSLRKERDYLDCDSSDSREDRRVSPPKRKAHRSSPSFEDGTSRVQKDHSRRETARREMRKSSRTDYATKMEYDNDDNSEGSRQDEKVPHSSKLSAYKRNSMSEDDTISKDVKDQSECEVMNGKFEKTDSIIKEQYRICQDSAKLIGAMVSDFPGSMVHGHSKSDGGQSLCAKEQRRREKSTSEDRKLERTHIDKEQVNSDDDSADSREDRKAADSPFSKAQKRGSMSPKDRNFMGIYDEEPYKKPKLEHDSVSGSRVSSAKADEHGFYERSSRRRTGNCLGSSKEISPSPSSDGHV